MKQYERLKKEFEDKNNVSPENSPHLNRPADFDSFIAQQLQRNKIDFK
jgi:hypothetical protein